jgi:hypothetical protein
MLTDTAVRKAKSGPKPYKCFDGLGLFVFVTPAGGKLWRLKYRFGGRENLLALGTYPATSLKQAREKRDDARKLLDAGIDPSAQRRIEKAKLGADTFESVAREWYGKFSSGWAASHADTVIRRLERDVFPPGASARDPPR